MSAPRRSRQRGAASAGEARDAASGEATPDPVPSDRRRLAVSPGRSITRPLKRAESIAREIVRDIVEQRAMPGTRLPAEALMTETYGVSRESLREALRILEVQGLVELRRGPGGGPVVAHVDPANLARTSSLYFHLADAPYGELMAAWETCESTLAELAARNPDAELRARTMQAFSGVVAEEPAQGDEMVPAYLESHVVFHTTVARLVGNRVLELMLQTPGLILSHDVVTRSLDVTARTAITEEHEQIADAIAGGQPDQARDLMTAHVRRIAALYVARRTVDADRLVDWS